ncbi:Eco57I restriction-modification methylase domain-containing protein [Planctomycetota bacterium]
MLEVERQTKLPRLLDLEGTPSASQRRWYWRYVHRWRRRLFYLWRQDVPDESDGLEVARGVDDLLAIALLLDYSRRSGTADLPQISEVHESLSSPTVAAIAIATTATVADPFISAVLDPQAFADTQPVPRRVFEENWQCRLRDATSLLYRDKEVPLSLFGDFHQICAGNPLNTESSDAEGRGKRRARGMFYTPAPIVDYLVSSTMGPVLNGQRPEEVLQLRVLDPSCGCGAFLIACFRYVSAWLERHPDCDHELACRLSLELMERVLHGCDIDPGAVSWTIRLQLLAAREMLRSRVHAQGIESTPSVPFLRETIRCRSFLELAPFRTSASFSPSYDAIIGGPPFVRLEQLHNTQRDEIPLYRRRYLSARQGQYDLYMLFIEQALDSLNEEGRVAFSLSNSFLRTDSGRVVRGYIAANACVEEVVEFEDPKTYDDAATQIALLRLRKARPRRGGRYAVIGGRGRLRRKLENLVSDQPDPDVSTRPLPPEAAATSRWKLASLDDGRWLEEVRQAGVPLGRLVTIESGLSTGIDRLLLLKRTGRVAGGIILVQSREDVDRVLRLEEAATRSVVRGRQLRGYQPPKLQHVHPFPYDAKGRPLGEGRLQARFPLAYAYLLRNQVDLSKRALAKGCAWYSTFCRRPRCASLGPRLLSAKIASGRSFSLIDDSQLLTHSSVVVLTGRNDMLDPYYLLGIVNSKVFTRYVSLTMPKTNVGRYSLRLSRLRWFPVPDPMSETVQAPSRAISSLVRDLVQQSFQHLTSRDLLTSIDRQVADLYGVDS